MHFKNIIAQTLCICLLSNPIYGESIDFDNDMSGISEINLNTSINPDEGNETAESIQANDISLPDTDSMENNLDMEGATNNPLKEINPNSYMMPTEQEQEQPEMEIDLIPDEEMSPVGLTVAGTENGIERIRTGWNNTEEGKKYILDNGLYAKGLTEIDGVWYAFQDNGVVQSGWFKQDGQDMYALNDGVLATGIVDIGDDLYAFNEQGYPMNGWFSFGNLYYAEGKGKLKRDWFEIDGKKYLALDNGQINMGWIIYGDKSYYQTELGVLTGMQLIDGESRLFGASGALANGPVYLNGARYICDEEGYIRFGWIEYKDKIMYTDTDGKVLTGWNTIDGENYYFNESGYLQTGFAKIDGELYVFDETGKMVVGKEHSFKDPGGISLSYNGTLYEGEFADPQKLQASYTGNYFYQTDHLKTDVTDPTWNIPAYGDTSLIVHTDLGDGEITIPAIAVDHVEANYTDVLYTGDKPMLQNIKVTVVYEDGTRKNVPVFKCELPETVISGSTARIITDLGNTTLTFDVEKPTDLHASYDGQVKEGEFVDPSKIHVWSLTNEGKHIYYDRFDVIRQQIFEDTVLKVKTNGKEIPCKVRCNQIESIKINGTIYAGESLVNRELLLRYSDGSAKTLTAGNYTWNNENIILSANAGKTNRNIQYLGRLYNVEIVSTPLVNNNTNNMSSIIVSGSNGNYSTRTSLGIWTLTAYADTPEDQGPYVGQTASGAPLVDGRTVAVSSATMARLGLQFGDRLEINGHVYTIEDHGGSAMYDRDWVDIFVADPAHVYDAIYNTPSEVFLLR